MLPARFAQIEDRRTIIDRRALSERIAALPAGAQPEISSILSSALAAGREEIASRLRHESRHTTVPNVTTTPASNAVYHSSTRRRSELFIDQVPEPAARLDESVAELAAKRADVNVELIRL